MNIPVDLILSLNNENDIEILNTHSFDFNNGIIDFNFVDYCCKNCGAILFQGVDLKYDIVPKKKCNEVIMGDILT